MELTMKTRNSKNVSTYQKHLMNDSLMYSNATSFGVEGVSPEKVRAEQSHPSKKGTPQQTGLNQIGDSNEDEDIEEKVDRTSSREYEGEKESSSNFQPKESEAHPSL